MCTDERILSNLFGVGVVAEERERDREDFIAVSSHDFNKRGFVASEKAADEFGIMRGVSGGSGRTRGAIDGRRGGAGNDRKSSGAHLFHGVE